jgi:hypothetical protein
MVSKKNTITSNTLKRAWRKLLTINEVEEINDETISQDTTEAVCCAA